MTRQRWMALCFALGVDVVLLGPFRRLRATGRRPRPVPSTFFIGSILFTTGGGLQSLLGLVRKALPDGGGAAWPTSSASASTLFGEPATYASGARRLERAPESGSSSGGRGSPDGSICFLRLRGAIAIAHRTRQAGCRCAAASDGEQPHLPFSALALRDLGRCGHVVPSARCSPGGGRLAHTSLRTTAGRSTPCQPSSRGLGHHLSR